MLSVGDKPKLYPIWNTFGDLNTPIVTGRETAGGLELLGPPLAMR